MQRGARGGGADLVVDSVGGVLVGNPGDDTRVALLADQREGALVGPKARELVGLGPRAVRGPVAQPAHARRGQLPSARAPHSRVYLYALKLHLHLSETNYIS